MKQRESSRRAIWNMEKSVQFEDPLQDLKQLEMLCGCGSEESASDCLLRNWVYTSSKMMSCKVKMRRPF
ncbi:unnamed protein product [Prunus armeniaca]|uniref:Uncharacterized protein n=1 Tax=Prunus armeniaca TaxID=36596 RepID=A0A6J5UPB8_PRUAR|nr:unnamed protein product [Prunus armeniaca]